MLPERLQELCDEIGRETDEKARLMKVMKISKNMPSLDSESLSGDTRVAGCTSVTHLEVRRQSNGTIRLRGFSDAVIARGLLALVVLGLNEIHEDVLRDISAKDILHASKLGGSMRTSRHAGIPAILGALREQLAAKGVEVAEVAVSTETSSTRTSKANDALHGRWSDRQGDDVAVLLSGGVDSSVALRLTQETGARVQAFYLKVWLDDELAHLGECPWEEDVRYAREVCEQAGVELHDVPFQQTYWDEVVAYTVAEARKGRTPNPDVMCNTRVKFGAFYQAFGNAFQRVVTGHYARRKTNVQSGRAELWLSADARKDQTYFLSHLRQDQLAKADFPVGGLTKASVRALAERYNLPNKARKDSQGICFLGKLKFDEFLAHHLGEERGALVEYESGRELGVHKGFWFFTVGQRRGTGLSGGPWHVVAKDVHNNVVYVSRQYYSQDKERRSFKFDSAVWTGDKWPHNLLSIGDECTLRVKTRHGPTLHDAVVTRTGIESGHVHLQSRDKGLAAGQFAAFYDMEGRCLGSGVIAHERSLTQAPTSIIRMQPEWKRFQAHV